MIVYLCAYKPQAMRKILYFEIYNEASILIISYLLIPFALNSIEDPEFKFQIGWVIIGVISMNIIANWVNLICTVVHGIYIGLKKKCLQRRI